MDIVCFSNAPWRAPVWTNKQQIASRLARRGHRVLYVEPGVSSVVVGRSRELEVLAYGLWRLKPAGISSKWWWARSATAHWTLRQVRATVEQLNLDPRLVLTYDPERAREASGFPAAIVLYDLVDHHPSFTKYTSDFGGSWWVERQERRLVKSASRVTATSGPLRDRALELGASDISLVQNAAADVGCVARPIFLDYPRPIVGSIGTLTPSKIDLALIADVAISLPGFSFVLVGPWSPEVAERVQRSIIEQMPANVYFHGSCDPTEAPRLAAGFDACLLASPMTEHTQFVLPLKIFDYLSSGRPIVATPMPSILELDADLEFVTNAAEAVACLEHVVGRPASARNIELAARSTWESRVDALLKLAVW